MLRPDLERPPRGPRRRGLRAPRAHRGRAARRVRDDREAFAEHWGQYEADEQRFEEWIDDPRFRRDLAGRRLEGRRAGRARDQRARDPGPTARSAACSTACARTRPPPARPGSRMHRREPRACSATRARRPRYLGVDTDNHNRALDLYESCGFEVVEQRHLLPQALHHGDTVMRADPRRPPPTLASDAGARHPGPRVPPGPGRTTGPPLTDVVNRARAADGVDEVFVADALRAEYEPMEWFDIGRDVLIAEIDGETVGMAFGLARPARDVARPRELGRRPGGAPPPGHRHGRSIARPAPGWLPRRPRTRVPASDRSGRGRSTSSGRTWPLLHDEGYVPIRFGFEMRRFLTGDLPEHAAPRRPRAPAGHPGPAPGDLRRRQRGLPRPLGPPRAGRGRLPRPLRAPRDRHLAVVRRVGRRPGRRIGRELDLPRRERAVGRQARLARARLGAAPVARPRRRQGAVRGLVPGPARIAGWRRHGWASTGRTRRARSSSTRASGSTSRAAGRRWAGRSTDRRPKAGARTGDEPA